MFIGCEEGDGVNDRQQGMDTTEIRRYQLRAYLASREQECALDVKEIIVFSREWD